MYIPHKYSYEAKLNRHKKLLLALQVGKVFLEKLVKKLLWGNQTRSREPLIQGQGANPVQLTMIK